MKNRVKIFRYELTLHDPIAYSRGAFTGSITPPYFHATALNHAFAASVGQDSEFSSYLMCDDDGDENVPDYDDSEISSDFYLTPARPKDRGFNYEEQIVKGDQEGYLQIGYGNVPNFSRDESGENGSTSFTFSSDEEHRIESRNEILKASRIAFIEQETQFYGYLITESSFDVSFPSFIRLGTFRGKVKFDLNEVKIKGISTDQVVDHPVDPLVLNPNRGVMVNMFPYPVVDNSECPEVFVISHGRFEKYVGINEKWDVKEYQKVSPTPDNLII